MSYRVLHGLALKSLLSAACLCLATSSYSYPAAVVGDDAQLSSRLLDDLPEKSIDSFDFDLSESRDTQTTLGAVEKTDREKADSENSEVMESAEVSETLETEDDAHVLVSEVEVVSTHDARPMTPELLNTIYQVASTTPGRTATRSQLQEDINAIFGTGYFSNVSAEPEDTSLGVKVTFFVEPNPVLTKVKVPNRRVLTDEAINEVFVAQYGSILNLHDFQYGIQALNDWYQENDYSLAQVTTAPQIDGDGTVTLIVAEGEIESIEIRFMDEDGNTVDENGAPIVGKTHDFVVIRELDTRIGDIFQEQQVQEDIARVFKLGFFDDIRLSLDPGDIEPRKVKLTLNVAERDTGSVGASVGFNLKGKVFWESDYDESNFRGTGGTVNFWGRFENLGLFLWSSVTSSGWIENNIPDKLSIDGLSALSNSVTIEGNSSLAIEQFIDILQAAKKQERFAEYTLTLNNLGNVYANNKNYSSAIDVYEQGLDELKELNSPALKLLTTINLARLETLNGRHQIGLEYYYNALKIIRNVKGNSSLRFLLGEEIFKVLSLEWRFDSENNDKIPLMLSVLESTILLDMATIYSGFGDSQQALYIISSPQFFDSTYFASEELRGLLDDFVESSFVDKISDSVEDSDSDDSDELKSILFDFIAATRDELDSVIEDLPFIMEGIGLQVVFSDLDENEILDSLKKEHYDKNLKSTNENLRLAITDAVLFFVEDFDISNIENNTLRDLTTEGVKILEDYLASRNSFRTFANQNSIQQNRRQIDDLREIVGLLIQVGDNFHDSGELGDFLTSEEYEYISDAVELILHLMINNIYDSDIDVSVQELELLLERWPSTPLTQKYPWFEGLLWATLGNYYYKEENYHKAAPALEKVITAVDLADAYLQDLIENNEDKIDSQVDSFSETVESVFEEADADSFGRGLTQLLKSYRELYGPITSIFISNLNRRAADSFIEVDNPSKAKPLYESALVHRFEGTTGLRGEVSEAISWIPFSDNREKEGLSEIYYGLARAEFALGNLAAAQEAISEAISINNRFVPSKFITQEKAFTQGFFQYGYGSPNRGVFALNINAIALNSLIKPFSQDDISLSRELGENFNQGNRNFLDIGYDKECSGIVEYFGCRQKYFEFYIDLLRNSRDIVSSTDANIAAFEQSEQARTHSLQFFHDFEKVIPPNGTNLSLHESNSLNRKYQLSQTASYDDIKQSILDDETLLLEYFLGEEKSYLWVISKHKELQTFVLPPRLEIETKAKAYFELLTTPSGRARPKATAQVGEELSDMILGPIKDQLKHQRLLIVADGVLQYLPFNALPNPDIEQTVSVDTPEGEFAQHLEPLIIEHEIVFLPSASSLVAMRKNRENRREPEQELAFFADPVFNHKDRRFKGLKIGPGDFEPFEDDLLDSSDILYSALPDTALELSQVSSDAIPTSRRQAFLGFDASLEKTTAAELPSSKIVHFASHGILNVSAPHRSGVVLSAFNQDGALQPGLLSPDHAFKNMDLSSTEIVILSGCRTGFGRGDVIREGFNGLIGSLFFAGTERVIASLWSVQDEATRELMTRFYANLQNEEVQRTPSEALRAAQISMWEDPRWQTPYYWAAFVLQGEWQ